MKLKDWLICIAFPLILFAYSHLVRGRGDGALEKRNE